MYWRRGTLLALAVLSLALVLAAPGAAEAGPEGPADTAPPSLSRTVLGWLENWLSILRNPMSASEGVNCDHGSHIDPDGGLCIPLGPGGAGDGSNSDQGSHIDPDG